MLEAKIGNATYYFNGKLETYFHPFRKQVIGIGESFQSPYGTKKIIYADWTASGRLYAPIEEKIAFEFGPFVANTHTETNITGTTMTLAYEYARKVIKQHVHADPYDVLVLTGTGMTGAVNKLQRILGLKIPEKLQDRMTIAEEERPVIFITHMEHHSNHISWAETIGDVVCLPPGDDGNVNPEQLKKCLSQYLHRRIKIGSFTACSNVTGIPTPYYDLAKIMHEYEGFCFVDFSACAPYVKIDMHPDSPEEKLDAIFFAPHKFLGGPGTSGVLVFDSRLYKNRVPDHPGGGTVTWTNPWGQHQYVSDLEAREDGGTPGFLQAIRIAMCIKVKEQMGIEQMAEREKEMMEILFQGLEAIPNLYVLDAKKKKRLGIISFYVEGIHFNLIVRLLNDRFGIQVRGGCSCAGTYGHYLLNIDQKTSKYITDQIDEGDFSNKPGWVRLSIHPTMTNQEIYHILFAIESIVDHIEDWKKEYVYDTASNDFYHRSGKTVIEIERMFRMRL